MPQLFNLVHKNSFIALRKDKLKSLKIILFQFCRSNFLYKFLEKLVEK
jgi:hypothetical protein